MPCCDHVPCCAEKLLAYGHCQHQFLAAGSVLEISHNMRTYRFAVVDTEPSHVIRITDTDLETKVLPPKQVPASPVRVY